MAGGARDHLPTERANPASAELDQLSVGEAFDVFQREDESAAAAVAAAREDVMRAVELVADALAAGGRLFYVGAGTSGRLGVLDAAECPPTFLTDPELVQGVIAGGDAALTRAVEGAEDDADAAQRAMDERGVGERDVVLGVSAGGTTPFVHAALARARERGAATVFFACVAREDVPDEADVSIRVVSGPEVLAGSTRLKAGTVTKLVLNRVSTLAMVRLGKVHGNLMVDVNAAASAKLRERGFSLVEGLTGVDRDAARKLLAEAGWRVKTACVMHHRGVGRERAEELLDEHGGILAEAVRSDRGQ